nr:hypothetical protein [Tanacetum cinerariifolium]
MMASRATVMLGFSSSSTDRQTDAKLRPSTPIFCRRCNGEMEAHYSPKLEETETICIHLQSTSKGLLFVRNKD